MMATLGHPQIHFMQKSKLTLNVNKRQEVLQEDISKGKGPKLPLYYGTTMVYNLNLSPVILFVQIYPYR